MKPEELTHANIGDVMRKILEVAAKHRKPREPMPFRDRCMAFASLISAVGVRYADCTLDTYQVYEETAPGGRMSQRAVYQAVRDFCDNMPARLATGGGLLLFGAPGTGKDHLVVASLGWAILRHGLDVRWADGITLFQRARDRIGTDASEREFVESYTTPDVLAISDPVPPKGDTTPYASELLQRIFDRRYRDRLSTWATMNVHTGSEAEARLASPIVDRLRHGSLCLQCEWESYRKKSN